MCCPCVRSNKPFPDKIPAAHKYVEHLRWDSYWNVSRMSATFGDNIWRRDKLVFHHSVRCCQLCPVRPNTARNRMDHLTYSPIWSETIPTHQIQILFIPFFLRQLRNDHIRRNFIFFQKHIYGSVAVQLDQWNDRPLNHIIQIMLFYQIEHVLVL